MPLISYTQQWSVSKYKGRKKVWSNHYEPVLVDVTDEVAAFLAYDKNSMKRYTWKTDKQKRRANIHKEISFEETAVNGDGEEYFIADFEDTYNPENRDPLSIVIHREDLAELDDEYVSTMTEKQYEVFSLFYNDYNNIEAAAMLGLDESSVRERLHTALKAAIMAYLTRSNFDLFLALHNEFKSQPESAGLTRYKFNEYLGVLFINRLSFFRPDQKELIDFVHETDYDAAMKKYFFNFLKTPEKG